MDAAGLAGVLETAFSYGKAEHVIRAMEHVEKSVMSGSADYQLLARVSAVEVQITLGLPHFIHHHSHNDEKTLEQAYNQAIDDLATVLDCIGSTVQRMKERIDEALCKKMHSQVVLSVVSAVAECFQSAVEHPFQCVEFCFRSHSCCLQYVRKFWNQDQCDLESFRILGPFVDWMLKLHDLQSQSLSFGVLYQALLGYGCVLRKIDSDNSSLERDVILSKMERLCVHFLSEKVSEMVDTVGPAHGHGGFTGLDSPESKVKAQETLVGRIRDLDFSRWRAYLLCVRITVSTILRIVDPKHFWDESLRKVTSPSEINHLDVPAIGKTFFDMVTSVFNELGLISHVFSSGRIEINSWNDLSSMLRLGADSQEISREKRSLRGLTALEVSNILSTFLFRSISHLISLMLADCENFLLDAGFEVVPLRKGQFEIYLSGSYARQQFSPFSCISLISFCDERFLTDHRSVYYLQTLFSLLSIQLAHLQDFRFVPAASKSIGNLSTSFSIFDVIDINENLCGVVVNLKSYPINSDGVFSSIFSPSHFLDVLGDSRHFNGRQLTDLLSLSYLGDDQDSKVPSLYDEVKDVILKYSSLRNTFCKSLVDVLSVQLYGLNELKDDLDLKCLNLRSQSHLIPELSFIADFERVCFPILNCFQLIVSSLNLNDGAIGWKKSNCCQWLKFLLSTGAVSAQLVSRYDWFISSFQLIRVCAFSIRGDSFLFCADEMFSEFTPDDRLSCVLSVRLVEQLLFDVLAPLINLLREFIATTTSSVFKKDFHWLQGRLDHAKRNWTLRIQTLEHFGLERLSREQKPLVESFKDSLTLRGANSGEILLSRVAQMGLFHLIRGKRPKSLRQSQLDNDLVASLLKSNVDTSSKFSDLFRLELVGNHRVLSMGGFHFKLFPEGPAFEQSLALFSTLVFGANDRVPTVEFARLDMIHEENGKMQRYSYPISIISTCLGDSLIEVFQRDAKLSLHINRQDFSALSVLCMLFRPEDAKPESLRMRYDPFMNECRLSLISNERLFIVDSIGGRNRSRVTVKLKCILFCMSQMLLPVDEFVRTAISSIDLFELLEIWLLNVQILDAENQTSNLFKLEELQWLLDTLCSQDQYAGKDVKKWEEARYGTCVPFFLGQGSLRILAENLLRLQEALSESSNSLNHFDLLSIIDPALARVYMQEFVDSGSIQPEQVLVMRPQTFLFKAPSNPRQELEVVSRFLRLTEGEYNPNRSTKLNPLAVLSSAVYFLKSVNPKLLRSGKFSRFELNPVKIHNTIWNLVAPTTLLQYFSELVSVLSTFNVILSDFSSGNFESFNSLALGIIQERVLNSFSLSHFSTFLFRSFVSDACLQDIRVLSLAESPDVDIIVLKKILSSLPELCELDVSGCKELPGWSVIPNVSNCCPHLKSLRMRRLNSLGELSNIRWNGLTSFCDLESLTFLDAGDCPISTVDLKMEKLRVLDLNCCKANLDVLSFRKLNTSHIRELRLDGWSSIINLDSGSDFFPQLDHLIFLSFRLCPKLLSVSFSLKNNFAPLLSTLVLDGCPKLAKVDVFCLQHLTSVSLADCPALSDIGMCPKNLRQLNLSRTSEAALNSCLNYFFCSAWKLCEVLAQGVPSLSDEMVELLRENPLMWKMSEFRELTSSIQLAKLDQLQKQLQSGSTTMPSRSFSDPSLFVLDQKVFKQLIVCFYLYQSNLQELTGIDFGFMRCGTVHVSDEVVAGIAAYCSNLQSINLKSCVNVSNHSLRILSHHCPQLNAIDVSWCSLIDDEGIFFLTHGVLGGLRYLNLAGVYLITDYAVQLIASTFSGLQHISTSFCSKLTDAGIIDLARSCSNLKSLDISACPLLSDMSLNAIASNLFALISLDLSECFGMSQNGLRNLFRTEMSGNLVRLSLNGFMNLNNFVFEEISQSCKKLKALNLEDSFELSEGSLAQIIRRNKKIKHLDIRGCPNVTDKLVGYISMMCDGLQNLLLSDCPSLSDSGLQEIAKQSKLLEHLWIENCPLVTNSGLLIVASCCDKIQNITIRNCSEISQAARQKILWMRPTCIVNTW
jgi:F-box/leucine-rich repeat protein 2/20